MIKLNKEIIDCDVLVVGGGIGGLMASISAAQKGAKVIVAEKANTKRSGSGATGNDHFVCYIPEYHKDFASFMEMVLFTTGNIVDRDLVEACMLRSFEVVQDWEKWGINMRPHGTWEFNGHAMPEKERVYLKYDGRNQKPVLTKVALENGVKINNRSPICEFILGDNGQIAGAVAIDISANTPMIKIYRAKCIITATGIGMRLFPSTTPGWLFNACNCPAGVGAGRAAAFRLGASLTNMDLLWTHAGPKYMERCGKATWIGYLSDQNGNSLSPFVNKPNKELGDFAADFWQDVFAEKRENGTGPVFMNCTDTDQSDMEYMRWGLQCEGVSSLLEAMELQDIDLSKDVVEFTRYKPNLQGRGLLVDIHHETTIKGLYCVGDEAGNFDNGIGGAAVSGRRAGEFAAEAAKEYEFAAFDENHPTIVHLQQLCQDILARENGAIWEELNIAIQQIMEDYVGIDSVRSESKMSAGLKYLFDLEQYAKKTLSAKNSHELMRALECLNLLEMGKAVFASALARKESRGNHRRADCTYTNPLNEGKMMTVRMENGKLITALRKQH